MEGVLIDTFRIILTQLEANDLCRITTVSKQWCYESNSPLLWRELFSRFYTAFVKDRPELEDDIELLDLARKTSLPQIYNDWKRAYIVKSKYNAPQDRVLCLSNCMIVAFCPAPFLDKHKMRSCAHQPLMFERFSIKLLQETSKLPVDDYERYATKFEPCPGLFQQIYAGLGEDMHRAWMVVDTSRAEDLAERLSQEPDAIYCSLMGSFFNLTNVYNIPYLVKVDSCSSFCEHVYNTSGGQWCYLMVEHPSLQSHIDSVWYLNIDKNLYPTKEIKTMAFLRRHLMKFYTWFDRSYFRLGELQSIIMILHVYEQSARDELFYETLMTSAESNLPLKTPVLDYYILVDDGQKFFSHKIALIRPDFVPTKIDLKGKKDATNYIELVEKFTDFHFLLRSDRFVKKYYDVDPDEDLIPQLRVLRDEAKRYGIADNDLTMFFCCYYSDPNFMEDPEIKPILNGSIGQDSSIIVSRISEILIDRENSMDLD